MEEDEEKSLSDKTIKKLKNHLLNRGWSAEEIFDLLDFITKE